MYAIIGNHDAVEAAQDRFGGENPTAIEGKTRTVVVAHADDAENVRQVFSDITGSGGVWDYHAAEGAAPKWVASDNEALAAMLSGWYQVKTRPPKPEGERKDWAGSHFAQSVLGSQLVVTMLALGILLGLSRLASLNLRTTAGLDWQAGIMGNATAAAANFMALSATSGESAAHTALAGEITTASGGLIRAGATYAHTGGASTYTLTHTFTANGSDALPVTVKQVGVLNASSVGTLAFEKIITDTLFAASGDAATVTYTVTP